MKDSYRIKKLRNRIIVLSTAALALAVGYYFLYSSLYSLKTEAAQFESEAVNLQGQKDNQATLKKQYDQQLAERTNIESFIVKKGGEADFINVIESTANQVDVAYKIESVNVENTGDAANLQALHLRISVSGSFVNVYQFLLLLENLPYHITLNAIDLTANGTQNAGTSTSAISNSKTEWQGNFDIEAVAFK